jgi:hypothetical protein
LQRGTSRLDLDAEIQEQFERIGRNRHVAQAEHVDFDS